MPQSFGVVSHPLGADEDVAFQDVSVVGVVEGDDIGERIVAQVLHVHAVQVIVGAKNIGELHDAMLMHGRNFLNPTYQFLGFGQLKIGRVFYHKLDAGRFVVQRAGRKRVVLRRLYGRGAVHAATACEVASSVAAWRWKVSSTRRPSLLNSTSSAKWRMRKMPRPPGFSRFSGAVGSSRLS